MRIPAPWLLAALLIPTTLRAADPPKKLTAKEYAAGFNDPVSCEAEARRLLGESRQKGWSLLRACVDLRNDPDIRKLLDDPWRAELRERPDAGQLLAQLMAMRGGNLQHDLALCHAQRVPVFGLKAAMAEPATYKGRWVILRGTVKERRTEGGKTAVEIAETSLQSETVEISSGPKYVSENRGRTNYDVKGNSQYTGSFQANANVNRQDRYSSGTVEERNQNTAVETGEVFIGKLDKPDPFLEVEQDYIFLVRFVGVVQNDAEDSEEPEPRPTGTILAYFRPASRVAF